MGAESAEDEAEFIVRIAVPVETAEHEEPAAGRDLLPHPLRPRLPGRMTQVYCGSTPRSLTIRWAITRSSAMNFRKSSSFWPAGPKVLSPKPGVAINQRTLAAKPYVYADARMKFADLRAQRAENVSFRFLSLRQPPVCSAPWQATAFDVALAFLSPVFLDLARRRSPWSDGLPPSPSSSSCRWFPRQGPTRRLGRMGTQKDL